jgi:hypothetical protein
MNYDDVTHWQTLLLDVRDKREAAVVLCSKPPTREFSKALREWWGATESALRMYRIELAGGRVLYPPPLEILEGLENMAGYLAIGQMPGVVDDAISEGNHTAGPGERRDIGIAVAYMMAATDGIKHAGEQIIITDKHHNKTVCDAFGIHRNTALGWRRTYKPAFPDLHPINGEILRSLMREAGERYKRAGRSRSAITERQTKRCTRN